MSSEREDKAFDALVAYLLKLSADSPISEEDVGEDALAELSADDLNASAELGPDILAALQARDREGKRALPPLITGQQPTQLSESVAMFRGDADLTPEARRQIAEKRRQILESEEQQAEREDDGED